MARYFRIMVLVVALTAFGWASLAAEKKAEGQTNAPLPEVEVAAVTQKDIPVYQEYVASMDGMINATILAQVQGYLIRQNYLEGSFVRKGALLFEIDPRPYEASVDVSRAVLARHEAVLNTARSTLNRILPLAAANAVSQKDKDEAQGRVDAAEAQVLASRAELRKAELELSFTKISSPIDGIVGAAQAQIGDLVGTPQSRELTTMSAVNPIKVYVPISEQQYLLTAEKAKKGQNQDAQAQFDLLLTDGSTWPHKGKFGFADRQVDPQTGTIRVAILFPNPDNILRPGQYAKVKALMAEQKGALLVPQRAVGELQGNYQVAVVGDDDTVKIRSVKVGERIGDMWVIQDGVQPGERVVAEGIQKVREGLKVSPKPYAPKQ